MKKIELNQYGQGLTEYITLLVLVSLMAVGAAQSLGREVKKKLQKAREIIDREVIFGERR